MLTIAPGVYRIRNVSTNQYLTPQGGYPSPGRQVVFESFSQDGAQKVIVCRSISFNPLADKSMPVSVDIGISSRISRDIRDRQLRQQ